MFVQTTAQFGWNQLLLSIGVAALAITNANAQSQSNKGLTKLKTGEFRVVTIQGRQLYVPAEWSFAVSSKVVDWSSPRAPSNKLHFKNGMTASFKPFEPFPGNWPISTDVSGLGFPLCKVEDEPDVKRTSLAAGVLPGEWCIHHVTLKRSSVIDFSKLPRLGPNAVSAEYRRKYLGSLDRFGFRKRFLNPKTGTANYFGFLKTDVAPSGSPIIVSCTRYVSQPGFWCNAGGHWTPSSLGVEGIQGSRFRWSVTRINPDELRRMFWRSQRFIEWLVTPPEKRSSKVSDKSLGTDQFLPPKSAVNPAQ